MDYLSTDYGADSLSLFSFRAWTNRQMRLTALPHASSVYTASLGDKSSV